VPGGRDLHYKIMILKQASGSTCGRRSGASAPGRLPIELLPVRAKSALCPDGAGQSVAKQLGRVGAGPCLVPKDAQGRPGRCGGIQHVVWGGLLACGAEIVGKADPGSAKELTPEGHPGPGRLARLQRHPGELREASLGVNLDDAARGLPHPLVDLEDLGLRGESLAGDTLASQVPAEVSGRCR
jgi:hypothetical protein